ncbi:leucine-rich repeat domain, L domain-like protein [Tanacetum coccineum]
MYGSRLHSLDLSLCTNVTDNSIASFASGCPSLSVIILYHCSSITDNGLEILTSFSLRIAGHAFKGLEPTLLNGGGSLECLHFTSIIGPWGHELSIIGLGFAANLKILNFQDVRLVNDEIVLQIAKGCPLLTEWNLSWCRNITTSGWNSIGLHCQNLEILHVTATSLSDTGKGLVAVGNGCRRLSVIYMKTKFIITPNWMHSFTTKRPDVEIINEEATQIAHSWAFIT